MLWDSVKGGEPNGFPAGNRHDTRRGTLINNCSTNVLVDRQQLVFGMRVQGVTLECDLPSKKLLNLYP
jgi:hypothetical protein